MKSHFNNTRCTINSNAFYNISFYLAFLINDVTLLVPNAIGVASGAYCASTYHKYSPEMPVKAYLASGSVIALASTCAFLDQQSLLGLIGCSVSVVRTCICYCILYEAVSK